MSDTADAIEGRWEDDGGGLTRLESLPTGASSQPSSPGRLGRVARALWLEAGTVLLVAIVVGVVLAICLGVLGPGAYDGMP